MYAQRSLLLSSEFIEFMNSVPIEKSFNFKISDDICETESILIKSILAILMYFQIIN